MYKKKICVTPLPYLNELPITNENAIILDFDLKNIKDVALKLKSLQEANNSGATNYENILKDNYIKYLAKGKSKYQKELKGRMKKIRAKVKFRDMQNHNLIRYVGDEFIVEEQRAKDLIDRGFAILIEDIKEKATEVEQAVKEVKKEKAVKEKAVKKNAKK